MVVNCDASYMEDNILEFCTGNLVNNLCLFSLSCAKFPWRYSLQIVCFCDKTFLAV